MTIRIVDEGPNHFNVEFAMGTVVVGSLEADYVGDQLPFESAITNHFWIGNVRVEPPWRRRGVGRALVRAAMDEGAAVRREAGVRASGRS
jgi:GNAT superfamily N-acetyltransferase